jgi:predicted DCC family thiol-disulfide oxidoreductase YuxK
MDPMPLDKPLFLYDGACGFCSASMKRWIRSGDGVINFQAVQSGLGETYGLPADRPMGAVHLVETSGEIRRGAAAAFRMMDLCGNPFGRLAWSLYRRVPFVRATSDWGYAQIAARRSRLSVIACRFTQDTR